MGRPAQSIRFQSVVAVVRAGENDDTDGQSTAVQRSQLRLHAIPRRGMHAHTEPVPADTSVADNAARGNIIVQVSELASRAPNGFCSCCARFVDTDRLRSDVAPTPYSRGIDPCAGLLSPGQWLGDVQSGREKHRQQAQQIGGTGQWLPRACRPLTEGCDP